MLSNVSNNTLSSFSNWLSREPIVDVGEMTSGGSIFCTELDVSLSVFVGMIKFSFIPVEKEYSVSLLFTSFEKGLTISSPVPEVFDKICY